MNIQSFSNTEILKYIIISGLIVNACCVLQNIAYFYKVQQPEIFYDELDIEERNNRIHHDEENVNGNIVRENIIELFFN